MKVEKYTLISDKVKADVINRLVAIPCDGKIQVVISDATSKSAKQRGLQWRWYTEVAAAGVGGKHESTKAGVHSFSKWHFGRPILLRDDEFFAELYKAWVKVHGDDPDAMKWFVDNHIHTESFNTSQMAEFLTDFQHHYMTMVNLTNPDDAGRNLTSYKK